MDKENIFIYVIESQTVVRYGLCQLIRQNFINATIYVDSSLNEKVYFNLKKCSVDILILGNNQYRFFSQDLISQIKNINSKIKILIFAELDENTGAKLIKNGASGFLNKNCEEIEIVEAINILLKDRIYLSKSLQSKIIDLYMMEENEINIKKLTTREEEIALLLIKGNSNFQIAEKLNLKQNTISTFKNKIFKKLNVNNLVELIEFFKKNRL